MDTIDTSLSLLRGNAAMQGNKPNGDMSDKEDIRSELFGLEAPKVASKPIGKTPEQIAAISEVREFLKGGKSDSAAVTMNTMVNAATPILSNFDEVLVSAAMLVKIMPAANHHPDNTRSRQVYCYPQHITNRRPSRQSCPVLEQDCRW